MRKTVTLDEDVARLFEQENRRAGEAMKLTVNRVLRAGLVHATQERFVVTPLDLCLLDKWKGVAPTKILDQLEVEEYVDKYQRRDIFDPPN